MIVDPFDGGRCLSVAETAQLIAQLTDEPDIGPQTTFPVASHAAWISRILTNLARSFDMLGSAAERDAALELLGYVRLSPHA
jgi:hypothetical protein